MDDVELERLLLAVGLGQATPSDRAELEHHLIGALAAGGPAELLAVLESAPSFSFSTAPDPGGDEYCFIGRGGGHQVVVSGLATAEFFSLDVSAPGTTEEAPTADPRHGWFYQRWESLLGIDDEVAADLTGADRAVFLIALLEAEVMNGGLGQYLTNTNGIWADRTLRCLDEIGAYASREVLAAAMGLASRGASTSEAWDHYSEEFSRLDDRFLRAAEDLAGLTADRFMPSTGSA